LSKFVSDDAYTIRQKICDYLEGNNPLIDDLPTDKIIEFESHLPLPIYVRRMRNTSTWGGSIEIMSFVKIYNINVNVLVLSTNKFIEFISNSEKLVKISWNGGHYEPLFN
jgi:hypothetical protein